MHRLHLRLIGRGCEGDAVHVLKKFVFLDKLVFEHLELHIDLLILILEAINLDLRQHILLIEVFARF